MILVIGGAYQGKEEFVMQMLRIAADEIADGAVFPAADDLSQYRAVSNYHLRIRKQIEAGQDPEAELSCVIRERPKICIISDEIGSGLIPMEKADRDYREMVGRTLCKAAQEADEVWRIVCGIGQRIK